MNVKPLFPVAALALGAALATGAALTPAARAQTGAGVVIGVDATAAGAPLEPVWRYFGYDEINYTTTEEGKALLRALVAAQGAPVNVRAHFLFNSGDGTAALKWGSTNVYTEDALGRPVYDYRIVDPILDATLGAGALPFVELGFMPEALSTGPAPYRNSSPYVLDGGSFYPPRDHARWAGLVRALASHVKERHGASLPSWRWELWNEPDIGYWKGTFEDYVRLYDHTEAALHEVLPQASLGAPAVASVQRDFLARFLEHCATGTNAVTGQTGTRLDSVSFHAKGGVSVSDGHVRMDLGNQLRVHRAGFETVARSAFARTPVVISEADPDGCAACPVSTAPQNAYRRSPAYGAYEVAMMKHTLDLAAEARIELHGVLTWAFTFPGSAYFAGYRALATNGIHLPVMNAFELLGRLRGTRLPVVSSAARPLAERIEQGFRQEPDVDALASRDAGGIQVLVWHYHDDLVDAPPAPVTLRLSVPPELGPQLEVTHTRVDAEHGDAFTVWVSQGSPEAPSAEQLAALRGAMAPVVLSRQRMASPAEGALRFAFELPRFGLSLVTIAAARPTEPSAPAASSTGCALGVRATERPALAGSRAPSLMIGLLLVALGAARARSRRSQTQRS